MSAECGQARLAGGCMLRWLVAPEASQRANVKWLTSRSTINNKRGGREGEQGEKNALTYRLN